MAPLALAIYRESSVLWLLVGILSNAVFARTNVICRRLWGSDSASTVVLVSV